MLPTFIKVSVEPTVIKSLLFLNVFPININKYVLFLYNPQYQQVSQKICWKKFQISVYSKYRNEERTSYNMTLVIIYDCIHFLYDLGLSWFKLGFYLKC